MNSIAGSIYYDSDMTFLIKIIKNRHYDKYFFNSIKAILMLKKRKSILL